MKVKYKKLNPLAKDPIKANETDAGFDLIATSLEHPHGLYRRLCRSLHRDLLRNP